MKSNRIIWVFVSIVVFATISVSVTNLRSQNIACEIQDKSAQEKQTRAKYESHFPIVEYDLHRMANSELRIGREAKNKKYDKSNLVSSDPTDKISESTVYDEGPLPSPIPTANSNTIVIGEVLDAKAYLSNDKTGIYSEFTVRVNEILKNNDSVILSKGESIFVERPGGFVRYKNGHKRLYSIEGKGMLGVGQQYVLFLVKNKEGENYHILTGYEVKENKVYPIDWASKFQTYSGNDVTNFIKTVREAIAQPA